MCGVSRTPVREAMRRLESELFIRRTDSQRSYVAEWKLSDIEEVFTLRTMLDGKLHAELKEILVSLKDSKSDPEDVRIATEAQEPLSYTIENLDDFEVGTKGVTFLYDAGYPHVIQAFEPNGRYFFSYSELKPFIKREGPLGQFIQ